MTDHLLTKRQVAEMYATTPRSIERWVSLGKIPAPVKSPAQGMRWRASDIQRHIESLQQAERKVGAA